MTDWFELDGVPFGAGAPWGVAEWDRGSRTLVTQDVVLQARDGRVFGRDREDGPEWTFMLRPSDVDGGELLAELARLRTAWEGPRGSLLDEAVLRYATGGRTRRVFGRPRRFAEASAPHEREAGLADVQATFQLSDPLHYDDEESSIDLGIVPASSALLRFPTAPPFRWTSEGGQTVRGAVVGGDAPTPVTIRFHGPVARPWVRIGGVVVQVFGDLAWDQQLVVDARRLLITRGDGAPWPGMLSPTTRMADLRLAPGTHGVTFGGTDLTGTSRVEVAWRDAWRSL
ncbi:hypothetical protein FA014_01875 [Cellulomonas hominis]|uniref:Uncharacterized protein n=1 Tax=Cellulomonas hominis TaxID=156981 RepID=A0A7Z8K2S7_9CELL|nr:hypothetical protein [Cellulomonas hominis]TKR27130.1 hypothetical protein FA014_01875 [Cellulomonas hominis]